MSDELARLRIEMESATAALAAGRLREFATSAKNAAAAARDVAAAGKEGAGGASALAVGMQAAVAAGKAYIAVKVAEVALNGARAFLQQADTARMLEGRLRLVSSSAEEVAVRQRQLLRLAQETRQGFEPTVALYATMARNADRLGLSQEKLITLTRVVNQTVALSSSSAASAQAALFQLNQAMASGVLRGEEYNSVSEQTPELLTAIAKGIGVTRGELRQMAIDGELTSERVVTALLSQADAVDAQYSKMPETIGQALTKAGNQVLAFIGQLDKLIPVSDVVIGVVNLFTGALGLLTTALEKVNAGLSAFWEALGRDVTQIGPFALFTAPFTAATVLDERAAALAETERARERAANRTTLANRGWTLDGMLTVGAGGIGGQFGQFGRVAQTGGLPAALTGDVSTVARNPFVSTPSGPFQPITISGELDPYAEWLAKQARERQQEADRRRREGESRQKKLDAARKKQDEQLREIADLAFVAVAEAQGFDPESILSGRLDGLSRATALVEEQRRRDVAAGRRPSDIPAYLRPLSATEQLAYDQEQAGRELEAELRRLREREPDLIRESLYRNVFDGIVRGVEDALTRGLRSFRDFGRAVQRILINAVAVAIGNELTTRIMRAIDRIGRQSGSTVAGTGQRGQASFTSVAGNVANLLMSRPGEGGLPILSWGGRAGGAASSTTPGASSAANPTLGSRLITAIKGSPVLGGASAGLGGLLAGAAIGNTWGTGAGVAGGIASGAAMGAAIGSVVPGLGTVVGGIVGGIGGAIGGIFGGNRRRRRQREGEERRRQAIADFGAELNARNLEAAGDDEGATLARLAIQQKRELDEAIKAFGANAEIVRRLRTTQAAELAAVRSQAEPAGVYLAPSDFRIGGYRFEAGRPTPMLPTGDAGAGITFTGDVTIAVPEGTSQEQARSILRDLQGLAVSQGYSPGEWYRAQPD